MRSRISLKAKGSLLFTEKKIRRYVLWIVTSVVVLSTCVKVKLLTLWADQCRFTFNASSELSGTPQQATPNVEAQIINSYLWNLCPDVFEK